jgi:P2-related tail formation protein
VRLPLRAEQATTGRIPLTARLVHRPMRCRAQIQPNLQRHRFLIIWHYIWT